MTEYITKFGSQAHIDKGKIEMINDQANNYPYTNKYEGANASKTGAKGSGGTNNPYRLEARRAARTREGRT